MPRSQYNPFDTELSEVRVADLEKLRSVSEGWYVEYKRSLPIAQNVAKSVSAFANTHGGWLMIGVDAPSSSVGTAQAFPGIPTADVAAALQSIRDGVASHLNPHPFFETFVWNGPCEQLQLDPNHSILVVSIPEGHYPPYVHSSGRIFVRVGDKSDPVPEPDRGRLQQLFARAKSTRRGLKKFLQKSAASLSNVPHLQLFLLPDPYDERGWRQAIPFSEFAKVMRSRESDEGVSIPYQDVQTVHRAFMARGRQLQITPHTHTYRFTKRGEIVLSLPLPNRLGNAHEVGRFLNGYENAERFVAQLGQSRLRVIDLSLVYLILVDALDKAKRLRKLCNFPGDYGETTVVGTLRHIGGAIPFIDTDWFIRQCEENGLPLVVDAKATFPSTDLDDAIAIPLGDEEDSGIPQLEAFAMAIGPCLQIVEAFGVPRPVEFALDPDSEEWSRSLSAYCSAWMTLLTRAQTVQQNRTGPRALR